ncbi:MAG: recombinase family protein [Chloroflexota bacterium]|nr:recombinase family protein [Chloroflexota bacterium]
MRAGIYYRVSSEEQVDGFSLDAQRRVLTDHCAAKGWQVADEYADEGKSARGDTIEKRPAFKRMMEDAESGVLEVVVVHKIDRFARNIRVTFEYLELLARHGVGFVAVAQPDLDYTRPEGRLFMGMMATLAQYYSDNLSQETKKGKAERKAQGLHNGHIPFGMMKGSVGIPVANPDTIEGLRLAFTLAAEGCSDREIAQALNDAGYRVNGNRGPNPFSKDTVCAVLKNRFYLGELPGKRPAHAAPAQHQAVIDSELWEAAQEQRERRATSGRSTINHTARVYSLSGLGVCGHCGGKLRIQNIKGRPRLFCARRLQDGGCTYRSAFLARYEEQLGAYLTRFTIPTHYHDRLRLFVAEEAKKAHIDTAVQRRKLERQLERLKDLYRLGDIEREEYLERRGRVQRDLATLRVQQADEDDQLDKLAELLGDVVQGWTLATQEQRNRLARLVFEEVVIENERVTAVKPRPELAGFFALDCQVRGLEVNAGGSDGDRLREIDVVQLPLVPFLYPERLLRARQRRGAGRYAAGLKGPRLSPECWPEIAARAEYESLRDLAVTYGVSHETIRGILGRVIVTSDS